MASTPSTRLDALRDRIDEAEDIDEADAEMLRTFDDRLALHAQTYSGHRHEKLLRHAVIMAEQLEGGLLVEAFQDREAAEAVVTWINRTYDNEETNRDYRVALRVFGRRVAESAPEVEAVEEGRPPASLTWVPTGTSSDYDPTPDPRDMLRWDEEIQAMLDAAYNPRDEAMVALQFDAGLRGGEFKSLEVGDIQDSDTGLQVTVEGKQGRRTVTLIPSVPHVNKWLDAHPGRDDPEAPLWSKLHEVEPISDRMVSKILDEMADRAGVEKDVTLTNFRKSSAAFLASGGINQAHIEDHHGWVRGSDAAARYISVFTEDADREIARLWGKDIPEEDERDEFAPLVCTRCEKETPRHEPFCVWCGQALDPEAVHEIEEAESDLRASLARLPEEKAAKLLEIAELMDDPEVRGALAER